LSTKVLTNTTILTDLSQNQ